jgi:hypothetical protein
MKITVPAANQNDFKKMLGDHLYTTEYSEDSNAIVYSGSILEYLKTINTTNCISAVISEHDLTWGLSNSQRLLIKQDYFMSGSVSSVTQQLAAHINSAHFGDDFQQLQRYLLTISLELMTNALRVSLDSKVSWSLYQHPHAYEIEVVDQMGTLTREKIFSQLKRAALEQTFERKEAGAGLGLFLVLLSSNQLIIEIQPFKRTSIRAIIYKYKRMKDYKTKVHALYIKDEKDRE